jgi:hypothetical protein
MSTATRTGTLTFSTIQAGSGLKVALSRDPSEVLDESTAPDYGAGAVRGFLPAPSGSWRPTPAPRRST